MKHFPTLSLILVLIFFLPPLQARDRILSFDSEITVQESGYIEVIEIITLRLEGGKRKRNIHRDIPTSFINEWGIRYTTPLSIETVKMNNVVEPYYTEKEGNITRIYLGRKNNRLVAPNNTYIYKLKYRINRALIHHGNFDELSWYIPGKDLPYPIERISIVVRLPGDGNFSSHINASRIKSYTGPLFSKSMDVNLLSNEGNQVKIETAHGLQRGENLLVQLTWPKGFVRQANSSRMWASFINENKSLVTLGVGSVILIIFYFILWSLFGKDPKPEVVIPQYTPPDGHTADFLRYIHNMGYDLKCFTSAIISLASKGYLVIEEDDDGFWKLHRTGTKVPLSPGERAVAGNLFGGVSGGHYFHVKNVNHRTIQWAIEAQQYALENEFKNRYLKGNQMWFTTGMLISAAIIILAAKLDNSTFIIAMPIIATAGLLLKYLIPLTLRKWTYLSTIKTYFHTLLATIVTFFVLGLSIYSIWVLSISYGAAIVLMAAILLGINWGFFEWLKVPTKSGNKLISQVEGFRHYLEVTREKQMDMEEPTTVPDQDKYLPYSVALDIDIGWPERLTDSIRSLSYLKDHNDNGHPNWYRGRNYPYRGITQIPTISKLFGWKRDN